MFKDLAYYFHFVIRVLLCVNIISGGILLGAYITGTYPHGPTLQITDDHRWGNSNFRRRQLNVRKNTTQIKQEKKKINDSKETCCICFEECATGLIFCFNKTSDKKMIRHAHDGAFCRDCIEETRQIRGNRCPICNSLGYTFLDFEKKNAY